MSSRGCFNFQPRFAQKSVETWIILLNVSIVFLFGLPLSILLFTTSDRSRHEEVKEKRERH